MVVSPHRPHLRDQNNEHSSSLQARRTRSEVGAANDGHVNLPGEGAGGGHLSRPARGYGGAL